MKEEDLVEKKREKGVREKREGREVLQLQP
jgi:hypothetical protein